MSAEGDFAGRGEPAQPYVGVVLRGGCQERGLRQVQLPGDRLHDVAVESGRIGDDPGGVAGEGPLGERVVLEDVDAVP